MSTPTTQSNTRITSSSAITITTITLTTNTITITTPTVAFSDVDQISISLLKSLVEGFTLRVLEAV